MLSFWQEVWCKKPVRLLVLDVFPNPGTNWRLPCLPPLQRAAAPLVPAESPRQVPCAVHGEGQRPDLGAEQQPGLLLTRQINLELFEGSVLALTESRGTEQLSLIHI